MWVMTANGFQRARSPRRSSSAKTRSWRPRARSARAGIRQVTLTDIADEVGMHKSAMLRYFETREQIFLRLTAAGWREWSAALRAVARGSRRRRLPRPSRARSPPPWRTAADVL